MSHSNRNYHSLSHTVWLWSRILHSTQSSLSLRFSFYSELISIRSGSSSSNGQFSFSSLYSASFRSRPYLRTPLGWNHRRLFSRTHCELLRISPPRILWPVRCSLFHLPHPHSLPLHYSEKQNPFSFLTKRIFAWLQESPWHSKSPRNSPQ